MRAPAPSRAGQTTWGRHLRFGRRNDRLAIGRDVLTDQGQGAVRRHDLIDRPGRDVVEQLIEVVGAQVAEVAVVDLAHRRIGACRQTLGVLQRDATVGCGRTGTDTQSFLGPGQ